MLRSICESKKKIRILAGVRGNATGTLEPCQLREAQALRWAWWCRHILARDELVLYVCQRTCSPKKNLTGHRLIGLIATVYAGYNGG